MNPFYLCTTGECNCLASKKIEKEVITSPPDGKPIPFTTDFDQNVYACDENGYLKTKDRKARKEIKELRAEVERLNRMLSTLGKMVLNDKLVTTVEKYELFEYINS